MPRFLDTFSGQFIWVEDPSTVSYAILSHTWRSPQDGGEQTYTQVQEIRHRSRLARAEENSGSSQDVGAFLSDPELSEKIKGFCKVAREAGYRLVWIDACCIDKTSSAELAEAINSMFELYRLAEVCYVYLVDVPDGEDPYDRRSMFFKSRWHTRGWTLQEVIAPKRVVFLTATWTFLTTKMAIAATLADFTGIDVDILTGQATLATVSVARKMSWAARRKTTRVEDEAYSLLGIFGIHLSPIYGEGHNAFLRLQEEIVRTVPDYSIFAWGPRCTLQSLHGPVELGSDKTCPSDSGLFAQSARSFLPAHSVDMLYPTTYASLLKGAWPTSHVQPPAISSVLSPQGVCLQLVCLALPSPLIRAVLGGDESGPCEECLKLEHATRLALLPCTDQHHCLIALPCFQDSHNDLHRETHRLTTHARCARSQCVSPPYRTIRLGKQAIVDLSNALIYPSLDNLTLLHHELFRPSTSRFDRCISIPLWHSSDESVTDAHNPPEDNDSLIDIQLAPECAQVLAIAPLLMKRSDDGKEIIVTTSLSTTPPSRCGVSDLARALSDLGSTSNPETFHHHLELAITITQTPGRTRAGGASVKFAVGNFIYVSQSQTKVNTGERKDVQEGVATSGGNPFCPSCCSGHDGFVRSPALGPDRFALARSCETVFDCSPRERVLAELDDVIYVGSQQHWEHAPATARLPIRILRLSLECREMDCASRERIHDDDEDVVAISTLWLSVELSERFYRRVGELHLSAEDTERSTLRDGRESLEEFFRTVTRASLPVPIWPLVPLPERPLPADERTAPALSKTWVAYETPIVGWEKYRTDITPRARRGQSRSHTPPNSPRSVS